VRRAPFLVLAAVLLPGCGGGGGGAPLSRSDYAAKADAICSKYNKQTSSLGQPKDLEGLAKAFDKAIPLLDNALDDLHGLKPPQNEQSTVDQWLTQTENLRDDLTKVRDQARAKNLKGVQDAFAQAQSDDKQGNQLAGKLGLKVCSKG
jgi:hypothetical protein